MVRGLPLFPSSSTCDRGDVKSCICDSKPVGIYLFDEVATKLHVTAGASSRYVNWWIKSEALFDNHLRVYDIHRCHRDLILERFRKVTKTIDLRLTLELREGLVRRSIVL